MVSVTAVPPRPAGGGSERRPGGPGQGHRVPRRIRGAGAQAHRRTGHRGQGSGPGHAGSGQRGWRHLVQGRHKLRYVGWRGFDIRGALAKRLGLPVIYNNDGNSAALYAHHVRFGSESGQRSSVAAIVGTGLGGGIIEAGQVIKGAAGMAGELGHVPIPLDGLLDAGQPMPACNCGQSGDAESVASLTGIQNNLLPYWLTKYEDHELSGLPIGKAAKLVRKYAEDGDEMALAIFRQQAIAIGRLFTIAANFLDPDAYFLGGGVVEAASHFRDWYFAEVRAHTVLRAEQARAAEISLVPDLDMAGARGSAYAARDWLTGQG